MVSDEQVDAVARALQPVSWDSFYDDFGPGEFHHQQRQKSLQDARAAIAAYEATRPAVATINPEALDHLEKWATGWHTHFLPAIEDDNNYYRGQCNIDGKDASDIGEFAEQVTKLIRAVRGRLAMAATEVTDAMVEAARTSYSDHPVISPWTNKESMRAALAAALAEAGKEKQDG